MGMRKETLPVRAVQTPQENGTLSHCRRRKIQYKKRLKKSQNNDKNTPVKTTTLPVIQNGQTNIL
jgi:hypothetical protein